MTTLLGSLTGALTDTGVVTRRNLVKIVRVPEILMFALIQPILFVVLFAYVFGSAIQLEGSSYREFLIAGVFAQTVVFGATFTGAGVAEDMQKGIIDRFRSLPMSRAAVLAGRTASDVLINVASLTMMAGTGLLVGWRVRTPWWEVLAGFALLLLFSYALSWIMVCVALAVQSPEVVNNASFMVIFPLTFVANTFVPLENLPTAFKVFAEWNPVSSVTQASRDLFGNGSGVTAVSDAWPIQHPVLYTLLWTAAVLAVFVPLATRMYARAASR